MPESNIPINNLPDKNRLAGFQIEIANQQPCEIAFRPIQEIVKTIVRDAGFQHAEISIAIVDDPTIHHLNHTYLDHDYATDVLSFVLGKDEQNSFIEGEIVVSADTARRQSAEIGWAFECELLLYLVHGALHLVGFDDKSEKERFAMREAEKKYLLQMDIEIPESTQSDQGAGK